VGICLTTALVAFVSGLVPFVSAEAYLVSVSALAPGAALGGVVAAATFGQMAAKVLLYLTGRGLLHVPLRRPEACSGRVARLLASGEGKAAALVFASAVSGIPPFYVVTLAAGALGFPLRRFVVLGVLGRLLRFAGVFLAPRLL
jgi:membrane protein YqaA with SNARE-associated domain